MTRLNLFVLIVASAIMLTETTRIRRKKSVLRGARLPYGFYHDGQEHRNDDRGPMQGYYTAPYTPRRDQEGFFLPLNQERRPTDTPKLPTLVKFCRDNPIESSARSATYLQSLGFDQIGDMNYVPFDSSLSQYFGNTPDYLKRAPQGKVIEPVIISDGEGAELISDIPQKVKEYFKDKWMLMQDETRLKSKCIELSRSGSGSGRFRISLHSTFVFDVSNATWGATGKLLLAHVTRNKITLAQLKREKDHTPARCNLYRIRSIVNMAKWSVQVNFDGKITKEGHSSSLEILTLGVFKDGNFEEIKLEEEDNERHLKFKKGDIIVAASGLLKDRIKDLGPIASYEELSQKINPLVTQYCDRDQLILAVEI